MIEKLKGRRVAIIFNLPFSDLPSNGYPCFAEVLDVEKPLIYLDVWGNKIWMSLDTIQKMWPA